MQWEDLFDKQKQELDRWSYWKPYDPCLPTHVQRRIAVAESGCWLFRGWLDRDGYGRVSLANRTRVAHRAVYELMVGAIPEGLELDHLCGVKSCVNPAHLEPVDRRENQRRTGSWDRARSKRHCVNGHEYTPENTAHRPSGRRYCRECNRQRARASYGGSDGQAVSEVEV